MNEILKIESVLQKTFCIKMSQHDDIKYSFQIFARVILDQHIYSFENKLFLMLKLMKLKNCQKCGLLILYKEN